MLINCRAHSIYFIRNSIKIKTYTVLFTLPTTKEPTEMKQAHSLMKGMCLIACFMGLMSLTSCIQDEPLNAECDITGVNEEWLKDNISLFKSNNMRLSNNAVQFTLKPGTVRTALSPKFYITDGAHLYAKNENGQFINGTNGTRMNANGMQRDFTTPQTYTVVAQDGVWQKDYSVSFSYPTALRLMSFENYQLENANDETKKNHRYHEWYEKDQEDTENPNRYYWDSGNAGYALTGMAHAPQDYPTVAVEGGVPNAEGGNKCVRLRTCDTGSFGMSLTTKMPIAAGNLFVGQFNVGQAVFFPRQATAFGDAILSERPVRFEGYYKYKAGEVFTNDQKVAVANRHDVADIYAVVFEIDPNHFKALNGDDVLSSNRIVLMARIDQPTEYAGAMSELESSPWVHFEEPFRLMNGKEFSEKLLREGGYAIAVVATSSRDGAYFQGAIGSTLYIDEFKIVYQGDVNENASSERQ